MTEKKPVKNGIAKVPFIMQLEMLECGAASLVMVLAYFGKWVTLEEARNECGVSKNGSSIKNIAKAAKNYGLLPKAFRMNADSLLSVGSFPCIILWNQSHFVVLEGCKKNKVYINDPACGQIILNREGFAEYFSNLVLFFEPAEDFSPSGKKKSILSYVKEWIGGTRKEIIFIICCAVVTALTGIIEPNLLRLLVDYLIKDGTVQMKVGFLMPVAIVGAANVIISFVRETYENRINAKLAVSSSSKFFYKVLKLPANFFSQRMAGDILQRKNTLPSVAMTLVHTVAPFFFNAILMFLYLFALLYYNVFMALLGVISIAVNVIMTDYINKKRLNFERVSLRDIGRLQGMTVSGIDMMESIKASGNEDGYFGQWAGYQANVNNSLVKSTKIEVYYGIISKIVTGITDALIIGLGVFFIIFGDFTIGMLTAFMGLLYRFTTPALSLTSASKTMQIMKANIERADDILKYPEDNIFAEPKKETDYVKLAGKVEMKDVTFGYGKLDEPVLNKVSITINPGEKIAIVGGSGCGKSTVSKLISGLYLPWEGSILFDGKKTSEIDERIFRASVAVVDQEVVLFEDTVKNNIRLWDDSIEMETVINAARDAQIHDDILERTEGYDAMITENGRNFSGGQRQRLEIARALAQEPQIIILDEATSALDAKTEYEVVKAISERDITCIVIAHRLSTIRNCDRIIVLEHGSIVQCGTHEELVKVEGPYLKLVTSE